MSLPTVSATAVPVDNDRDGERTLRFFYQINHVDPDEILAKKHTKYKGTREPQPFDLHLPEHLKLKRVGYAPRLIQTLLQIAQQAMESRCDFPPVPSGSHLSLVGSKKEHHFFVRALPKIANEAGVVHCYQHGIGLPSACIAATLEFDLATWDDSALVWGTNSASSNGTSADADGFLHLHSLNHPKVEKLKRTLGADSELAVWEFKNILSGRYAVMKSIMLLTRQAKFDWTACHDGEYCCHSSERRRASSLTVGLDAGNMWCSVLSNAGLQWAPSVSQGKEAKRREAARVLDSSLQKPGGKKQSSESVESVKTQANHMIQQVWAEAVKNDCTFLVIHSGVYEIIGIRCRKTQTLYLSDLIHPWEHNDGISYGQLHVGLFIAILRDAMGRADCEESQKSACQVESVDKPISSQERPSNLELLQLAFEANRLVMRRKKAVPGRPTHTPKRKKPWPMFDGPYIRIDGSPGIHDTHLVLEVAKPGDVMEAKLSVCIADTTFQFKGCDDFSAQVIVKRAHGHKATEALLAEYTTYCWIQTRSAQSRAQRIDLGIPRLVGFFTSGEDDGHDQALLIMEKIGAAIDIEPIRELKDMTRKRLSSDRAESQDRDIGIRISFIKHMNVLHAQGLVYGRPLEFEHMLCADDGKRTAIVGLRDVRAAVGLETIVELQDLIKLLAFAGLGDKASARPQFPALVVPPTAGFDDAMIPGDLRHGRVEPVHEPDRKTGYMIPFFSDEDCRAFRNHWNAMNGDVNSIQCFGRIDSDFPAFLGPLPKGLELALTERCERDPLSMDEDIFRVLLHSMPAEYKFRVPPHKSARRIFAHSEEPEWLVVPFLTSGQCKAFGKMWAFAEIFADEDRQTPVTCHCYSDGHRLDLPYE